MVEQGADVIIVNYDRAFESVTRIPLSDIGASFITLEHSTTEKVGMKGMCDYLNLTFPEIEARFYCNEPQGNYIV